MKKTHLLLLALLSGLLFTISWPSRGFPLFLFFSFIPLLYLEDLLCRHKDRYHTFHALLLSYPGFFLWNLLTTWWICNSTVFGAIMAVLFNSLFMSLVFLLYHWTKRLFFGFGKGYFLLIIYWITFEYLHQNWDLTWSWLNIGNGFSSYPAWIQWYEYTGIFGGALWIFLVNITAYQFLKKLRSRITHNHMASRLPFYPWLFQSSGFSCFLITLLLPFCISLYRYYTYRESQAPVKVVIVQPNIDPYKEQYSLPPEVVMDRMLALASQKVDTGTDLLICPESAIQEDIWENKGKLQESPSYQSIQELLKGYPGLGVIIGASTFYRFPDGGPYSETARYFGSRDFWYDAYNTAIYTDTAGNDQLYHKSKLVVGVERMPFPKYLRFLEKFALNLGGTIGSLGISKERTVFHTLKNDLTLGTAICYESVYGDFFRKFVRNGASLMLIITNDGWWGNTPGHRQHLLFASLRAIENRRDIARSANTGISCLVDQKGVIHYPTPYWEQSVLAGTVNANQKITFYTRYGDYLGRISAWLSLLLIVSVLGYRLIPPSSRRPAS